ncbi:MAG: replication-associated recombination protein A [Acholeplasmataceae bacterium]|nr:replication-associated recombination protein A [Candidatus Izemoplasmatales bacterium]NLF48276.1 replication-associated recombination protein A [Acholeplasmataceae bacterium]
MYEPLANRMRPKSFEEVIGQDRIVQIIKNMLKKEKLVSLILYGPTGVGKTTIALLIAEHFPLNHFKFNASTDSKATLKQIIESVKLYGDVLLIIDEIHRMNRDIQDYLLPYVETGKVIMVGLTTENPYIACNPAIRSRASIFRLDRPNEAEIKAFLQRIDIQEYGFTDPLPDNVYDYLSIAANGEVRSAINMLEMLLLQLDPIQVNNIEIVKTVIGKPAISTDDRGDNYYDILSAFHKSVRGSDADAALHYLARLIVAGDLESLLRRISAIVYEDIGLANPSMGPKVAAACDICRHIGFPEAINALGAITIELCLSPKSNSAHLAINKAISDVESGKTYKVPSHLINNPTYDEKKPYLYPHDYPGHRVIQDYLPKELSNVRYYEPQDHTRIEMIFKEQYDEILQSIRKKR